MLTEYINQAMRLAKYEILSDGSFYAEIPGFAGVWSNTNTLDDCREELKEVLEEWLTFKLSRNLSIPVVAGIELALVKEA